MGYYIGLDGGSTYLKGALLKDRQVVETMVCSTGIDNNGSANQMLGQLCQKAGISRSSIRYTMATGYSRKVLTVADDDISEITAHAYGVRVTAPKEYRPGMIIDIGGQDSKIIYLDSSYNIKNFTMNDKCAAGTGKFMEVAAQILETTIDQVGPLSLESTAPRDINSTCVVFAQSEIISLIARQFDRKDILAGMHISMAKRIIKMMKKSEKNGDIIMLDLLIKLLSPIFLNMGVSQTDINTYVYQLGGFIYAILGTLVLAVVIIVVSQFVVKKGKRHLVSWGAALSWVLIVTILANVICFGPMYNNLAPIINGGGSVSPESAAASEAVIEKVGDEGIVLAENNGILPLSGTDKINVFGWAATNPIYGGTGSGSSSNEGNIDVLTSLKNAGFEVNQVIIDLYTEYSPTRKLGGNVTSVSFTDWSLPEPPVDRYTTELMDNAKAFSDTAVIVLARSGGEGQDLPTDMSKVIDGTVDDMRQTLANGNEGYNYYAASYTNNSEAYDDFAPGESYLQLSRTERDMIDLVTSSFDKVILMVNANNAMELGFVDDYDPIGAVLLAPGTGRTAMNGLGKILKGTVNPSGRTVETYVYDQKATPAYNNYGNFTYDNVDDLLAQYTEYDPAFQGVLSFVNYAEGIYVGYRFYETAFAEARAGNMSFDYGSVVQYPFGHGLSYTTFTQEIQNFSDNGDNITFDVTVTNTGSTAGQRRGGGLLHASLHQRRH